MNTKTKRRYEETHPWITFHLDASRLPSRVWMLLGEACSKCEHIANAPLRPEAAQDLYWMYFAKGVAGTTAIEGNTLSEEQVRQRLEGKLRLPTSKEYLQQEVDNIARAVDEMTARVVSGDGDGRLSSQEIETYNRQVLQGLDVDEGVVPGVVRDYPVGVLRYRGAPEEDCGYLMDRMCEWLNQEAFQPQDVESRMAWGFLRAILAHLYIAWIHPFGDGNGRTARLAEVQILLDACVPVPATHLLSNFYNQTRAEYYRQLDYASKSNGDVSRFILYALQGLVDGLKEQLVVIRKYQWEVSWRDTVFRAFAGKNGATDSRRRDLALALSGLENAVEPEEILDLAPRVARAYGDRTPRTLQRDLQELVALGLVRRIGRHYRANRERILSFLPPRRDLG